ncbi:MAG: hypothetical protein AB1894_19475 [Chloroflexota bacterium]
MEFEQLLEIVAGEPVFETGLLLAGKVDPANVHLQLTRWKNAGRVYQLRRGLYALAPPYQKVRPHPFLIANRLQRASYVSCQSALAFYGLIPDTPYTTISVTSGRSGRWRTPLGDFEFRHIQPARLRGYCTIDLGNRQQALVATPEKALLDLVYLQPGGDAPAYLGELRLQNLERLDEAELQRQARAFDSPKLSRAAAHVASLAKQEAQEYETL